MAMQMFSVRHISYLSLSLSYHMFESGVEVLNILGTFCLWRKSIVHIEEDNSTRFSQVAV